ncbi:MAG: stage III sporulation protein AA [Epulopiscium sp. Nuni2H_MBin003]|nr:MAG: stage III sporulation protein AA [Epulopiscium sp. Nuni2H_MBin003]
MHINTIKDVMPRHIRIMLDRTSHKVIESVEEIRIRLNKPIIIRTHTAEFGLSEIGDCPISKSYIATKQDLEGILKFISGFSLYAIEDEIREGFITIQGGHRVGIVGKTVVENKSIKTIRNISAINIRVAREVIGSSKNIVPYIFKNRRICNTLIVSPPKCGKTTILRDIIRNLSYGECLGESFNIGLVDERSEIAACFDGVPQNDIGIRTDVLDSCPKAYGITMLLRSMSPEVIAVDEIGKDEDYKALEDALVVGVSIICTIHGVGLSDCLNKPRLKDMIDRKLFGRIVILSNRPHVGSVEAILDVNNNFNTIG